MKMHIPIQCDPLKEAKQKGCGGSFTYHPLNLGKWHTFDISIQIRSPEPPDGVCLVWITRPLDQASQGVTAC